MALLEDAAKAPDQPKGDAADGPIAFCDRLAAAASLVEGDEPTLAQIIDDWDWVPEPVRARIAGMVESCRLTADAESKERGQ